MIQVLLAGVFCGVVHLCTVLVMARKHVAITAIPALFVLWGPYAIIFGIPAFILAGIASSIYWLIDKIPKWYWHIPIVLALVASGFYICFSMDQMGRGPEILGLPVAFWGLPIVGTLGLYPVVSLFIRGEGKESILFFSSSAAICGIFSWGFVAAFGGRETALADIRYVIDQFLSPYQVSHHISDVVIMYVDIVVVTLIFLGCIIIADLLSRSRPFEALKNRIHRG